MNYYYRGLPVGHPSYEDAVRGFCRAPMPDGTLSPREHNSGIPGSGLSQYTSWTSERAIAEMHAVTLGGKGLLLKLPQTRPSEYDKWQWVGSPDKFNENEVLLVGERFNCEVIFL